MLAGQIEGMGLPHQFLLDHIMRLEGIIGGDIILDLVAQPADNEHHLIYVQGQKLVEDVAQHWLACYIEQWLGF